jgi:hypothetical protein
MKLFKIVTLAAGISVVGLPALAQEASMSITSDQIMSVQTASIVTYDDEAGLPADAIPITNDIRQWLGSNAALSDDFEAVNFDAEDVDAVSFANGTLTLYVEVTGDDENTADDDDGSVNENSSSTQD